MSYDEKARRYTHLSNSENNTDVTPIILVHGLGRSSQDWSSLLPLFGGDALAFAPNLAALRDEEHPANITEVVSLLILFVESLGIEKAHWVGSSLGGHICAQIAVEDPQKVASLALLNSTPTENTLEKIKAPMLLLDTEDDPVWDSASKPPEGTSIIRVRLKNGGHLPMVDAPQLLFESLSSFQACCLTQ
jgi:pimeloyl-ACP methyl ester carboxylesterase